MRMSNAGSLIQCYQKSGASTSSGSS
jgi:hypothetical protein